MQLYPNARLLIAAKEDFTRERRKLLTAKMASGAWDGIITTHSSFERIGMSRDFQERFLREQIAAYDQLLCDRAAVPAVVVIPAGTQGHTGRAGDQALQRGGRADA